MASRNRNRLSTARSTPTRHSVAPATGHTETDQLPPYRKPSHPLNAEAARLLREIQGRRLTDVKRHNEQATVTITSSAESVNDMLRDHAVYIERRQKKWDAGKNLDEREDEEREMRTLQEKVDEATIKLEESIRAVIDSRAATQRIDDTLDWLRQNAPKHLEEEYQTQMTQRATQRQLQSQAQGANGSAELDSEEEVDEPPTPGPTPLDGSRIALTGPSELFISRMQNQKDAYTALSLTARYARNNTYRDFKRIVHDAKYHDDAPPLGHEDTWFNETGSPAPGITDGTQRGEFDDDDDIVVDKATISTRCPLTFQQFKEPYTSIKCPHTFEKNAIIDMIRTSGQRVGGNGQRGNGTLGVTCPVTGCAQILTAADLRADPILIRKIKRMQQAEAIGANESSEDEEEDDDGDGDGDGDGGVLDQKQEPRQPHEQPRGGLKATTQLSPNSSHVENLRDSMDCEDEL